MITTEQIKEVQTRLEALEAISLLSKNDRW